MINKLRKWPTVLAVLALLAVTAVPARASVLLSSLIPSGSITSGNLTFSNFTYSATGDMPPDTSVNVNVIPGGIQFQAAFFSGPGVSSDALITYTVTVNSGPGVTGANISGNPAIVGGTGSLNVVDTFAPTIGGSTSIFSNSPGSTVTSNSLSFGGSFLSFPAQKDIEGVGGTGSATLSFVDQTYNQPGGGTPEPTSIVLMGFGVVGLVGYAWRKRFTSV